MPYIGNMDMNKGVISDQKTKKAKKTKHFLEKQDELSSVTQPKYSAHVNDTQYTGRNFLKVA